MIISPEKKNDIAYGAAAGGLGIPAYMVYRAKNIEKVWDSVPVKNRWKPILLWMAIGGLLGGAAGAISRDTVDVSAHKLKELGFTTHE